MLSGSPSKGKYKYYYYYHCSSVCGCRYNAENVNEKFVDELKHYVVRPEAEELYKQVMMDVYRMSVAKEKESRTMYIDQLAVVNGKLEVDDSVKVLTKLDVIY